MKRTIVGFGLLALATGCSVVREVVPVTDGPAPVERPDCVPTNVEYEDGSSGPVVFWSDAEPMTCDVEPPMTLVLTDISEASCELAGGVFDGDDGCWDVDY